MHGQAACSICDPQTAYRYTYPSDSEGTSDDDYDVDTSVGRARRWPAFVRYLTTLPESTRNDSPVT